MKNKGKVLKLMEKQKEKEKSWGKIEYYSKVAAQLVGFCQESYEAFDQ